MKRIILTVLLLLGSCALIAQGLTSFNYYRIETKVGKTYSAIETEGRIFFTTHSIIVKSNNDTTDDSIFIINKKIAESEGKIVYMTTPIENKDIDVVIEHSDSHIVLIDMSTKDGVMFLNEVMRDTRIPLPTVGEWYEKIKERKRHKNREI